MDLLGIGPLELVFVFVIILLVLGPNDLIKTGRTIGRFLNKVVKSDSWRAVQEVSREIRSLPNRLVREANLEDALDKVQDNQALTQKPVETASNNNLKSEEKKVDGIKAWTTPPGAQENSPKNELENTTK